MNPIVLGIIGTGRIGSMHLENICTRLPEFKLKWACDLKIENDAKMIELVKRFNIPNLTTDYKKVLADPEVQAIIITTSTDMHTEITLAAAAAGKDIFCEKPLSHSIEETKKVIKVVKDAKVKFQIGFNRRFDHNFSKLQATVASGDLGRPQVVRVTSRDPTFDPDYIERSSKDGGILIDMTIHDFDMANFVYQTGNATEENGNDIESVYTVGSATIDPIFKKCNDHDLVVITLKLRNGSVAIIENSRRAVYGYDQRLEAFCTAGMVTADNDTPTNCKVYTAEKTSSDKIHWWFFSRYKEAFINELQQFADTIRHREKPSPVGGEDMLRALILAEASKESLLTGKPVQVPDWRK